MGSRNAKRIKDLNGMEQIILDLKPRRCDSFIFSNKDLDVTNLEKYLNNKKKTNPDITYFHAFVTALGKVFYNRPKMNHFVQNRHVYEHNDVVISFVAKVTFDDKSEEIMVMVPIKENDNIETISKYIKDKVDKIRNKKTNKAGANNAIDILGKLPNIIRIPIVGIFKWCDKMGILPASLIEDNLYYSSMIVSNIGVLGTNAIHHNITNFGTCSSLTTMGEVKDKAVIIKGKSEIRKICDWGIAYDERVADGFYMIKSLDMLQYIFDNPETLEDAANTKIEIPKK
jgi:hypothetical protein